ncbi:MAG: TonB-dependent receptor plug domain-containing protein [Opitutaceae bacterium]|nr:TonB-dependent receptor plug domain-containing protein [Opitutaceae bacterium]
MKPRISNRLASALLLTLGLQAPIMAQAVSDDAAAPPDQVVKLSPFTINVEKDSGYIAVDSLAGGRLDTPIRVTPTAVSSLTRQFINDLAITNIQDALKWSLNAVPTSFRNGMSGASAGDVFNFWSVSIRGDSHVQGGNPPTKNYFPTFMLIDTYNVDRIETDSGPNSILFGIGDIGGAMTAYTKTARFDKNFSQVSLSAYSYGGYRVTADINQSVGGHFALRLNLLNANEKGWRDGDNHKKNAVDLAGTYKFTDDTQISFEIEGWKEEKTVFAQSIQDGTSLWNQSTSSATWGSAIANIDANPLTTPGAPGVHAMNAWGGANDYLVWTPGIGLYNWAGGVRSMGTGDIAWGAFLRPTSFVYGPTGTTIMALPSREFAITPADGLLKPEALSMTLNFSHRINPNSEFIVSGYRYVDDAKTKNFEGAGGGLGTGVNYDLNHQLPNGQPNPNYGKLYSDFFLDAQTQNHWVNEVRGQFNYHFDFNAWGVPVKQLFSASAGEQVTEYDARQYQAQVLNNYDENNWTKTMLWGRIYWDHPQQALNVPTTWNGQNIAYTPLPFNWYDFNSKQTIKYYGVMSQTRLWDDRLNLTLGERHDAYDNWKVGLRGPSNTPTLSSGSGNTYTAGLVGYVTEWLGIVGNVSENYQPAAGGNNPTIFGKTLGPSFGKGKSIGLRLSTLDGKYYASANWYNQTSTDVIGGDTPDFQGIWNDYFAAGGTNTDIGPAGNVTGTVGTYHANMAYIDTYDVKYTGFEFEVIANPSKNFRLQLHYSDPKGEKTNDGPNATAYMAQHLATWQAAAGGSSAESVKLASDLTDAQNRIAAVQVPVTTGHLVKSIFNVFATYSFTDDVLRGLEIGAGATTLGDQYGNPWDSVNGKRTLSPGYTTYSMLVGYSTTFRVMDHKLHARFQLNVDNMFGKDTLVFLNYTGYGSGLSQPMDYNFIPPRKFTLSANFEF